MVAATTTTTAKRTTALMQILQQLAFVVPVEVQVVTLLYVDLAATLLIAYLLCGTAWRRGA